MMGGEFQLGGNLHSEAGQCPHCGNVVSRHPEKFKNSQYPTIHFFACANAEVVELRKKIFGGHNFDQRYKTKEKKNDNKSTSNNDDDDDDDEEEEKRMLKELEDELDRVENDLDEHQQQPPPPPPQQQQQQQQGATATPPPDLHEVPEWARDPSVIWTHPSLVIDYYLGWVKLAKKKGFSFKRKQQQAKT